MNWRQNRMKHDKAHYKRINLNGFRWYAYIDGLHRFSKRVGAQWLDMSVTEEDLADGSALSMAKDGISRMELTEQALRDKQLAKLEAKGRGTRSRSQETEVRYQP
jgi:hypothetical protein